MNEEKKLIAGLPSEELFASGHRACGGCVCALSLRHLLKAAGRNSIVVSATGCMEVISSPYPETSWEIPWIHCAFENAPAVASGIDKALEFQGKRNEINLMVIAGDGATFDIGFQSLSGALERGQKFLYFNYDNEAYMNTGIQRSSATFPFAATTTTPAGKVIHGKIEPKKLMPLIIASHGINYVATVSASNLPDFYAKVRKALKVNGPSFIHALATCPVGWHSELHNGLEILRKAVECRIQPLYEIEEGVLRFTQKIENPKPVEEYLNLQGRFKHLTKEEIKKIQDYVNERYEFLLSIEGKKVFDCLHKYYK